MRRVRAMVLILGHLLSRFGFGLEVQDHPHGLVRLGRGGNDQALVVVQGGQPVLDISRVVARAAGGFNADRVQDGGAADLGDQFLVGVGFAAEMVVQEVDAVQPRLVAGGVRGLVEGRAVILGHLRELLALMTSRSGL